MKFANRYAAATAVAAMIAPIAPVPALAQAVPPQTIPALQEWMAGPGGLTFSADARIVPLHGSLDQVADVLAEDLFTMTGESIAIAESAQSGDVILRLEDVGLPAEGYEFRVTSGAVTISAPTPAGVFFGTRTLLQLLAQDTTLPGGTARDWPRYPERGLMVDAGRKYHTADWFEQHIKDIAYLKMNVLHLHLSDNQGFRIESETHPEIVSDEYLTRDEVRHLLAVAERYHVTVLPEIDMPGHMTQILSAHPEFQLRDLAGQPNPAALDVTNPDALVFAREIIEEYIGLFPGEYWHGGADEYIHPLGNALIPGVYELYPSLLEHAQAEYGPDANHKDAYLGFINWMDDLVTSHGKKLRIWADGLHSGSAVTVRTHIPVEWWQWQSFDAQASELLAAGHPVFNSGWNPTYLTAAFYRQFTDQDKNELYWNDWEVHEFWGIEDSKSDGATAPRDQVDPEEPKNLGSRLHLWYDEPDSVTIEEFAIDACDKLRLIAQKTWRSPTEATWDEFLATSAAVGRGPGFTIDGPGACASPVSVRLTGGAQPSPDANPGPGSGSGQDDMPATGGGAAAAGLLALALSILAARSRAGRGIGHVS